MNQLWPFNRRNQRKPFIGIQVTSQKRGARANATKISHQERIFTRINMDELGFEVIRRVKIWFNTTTALFFVDLDCIVVS